MKKAAVFSRIALVLSMFLLNSNARSQGLIEDVIVETYYVGNADDASTEVGGTLAEGSTTYRIFIDLVDGAKIKSMYADTNHVFQISSTENFFNNDDRGETWGFDIPDNRLDENTVALDSWLSFGGATDEHWGVLKTLDQDGSFVGGDEHEDGLLINESEVIGIPLTEADGHVPTEDTAPSNFFVFGDDPISVLGDSTSSNVFSTHDFTAIVDPFSLDSLDNRILIAQLTTTGELSFDLNLELLDQNNQVINYVATDGVLLEGEILSPLLHFPPQCGCTDPNFLEFDPNAACEDGSCLTEIVIGCSDPDACNYDSLVNLNIPELCCILPDNCEGLDADLICPGYVGVEYAENNAFDVKVYPNPFNDMLQVELQSVSSGQMVQWSVYNSVGELFRTGELIQSDTTEVLLNTQDFERGVYILQIVQKQQSKTIRLLKM